MDICPPGSDDNRIQRQDQRTKEESETVFGRIDKLMTGYNQGLNNFEEINKEGKISGETELQMWDRKIAK